MTLFNKEVHVYGPKDIGTQLDRVATVLEDYLDAPEDTLTEWESEFVESLAERVAQYGASARMSPKQWEAFERIEGKLYGHD